MSLSNDDNPTALYGKTFSKKAEANNEDGFQGFLNKEKADFSRNMYLLSAFLFMLFGFIDTIAIASKTTETISIRFMVTVGLLIGFYVSSKHSDFFVRHYRLILAFSFIVTSCSIQYIINISTPADHSHTIYFAGLMLIIMSIFVWSFLSILDAILISGFILGIYISSAVHLSPFSFHEVVLSLLGNILFLSSSAVIGLISSLMRNKYLKQSYLLQESLKDAYHKKSIEAKDNEYLANHDALTDLPNRRYLMELLDKSLEFAATNDKVLVIMFIDLNGFKQVNDIYGHNAGDEVLVIVAKRLELAIRQGDHVSRIGGDEYLMGLMMEKDNLDEIETMTNKFVDIIAQPMNIDGLRLKVGASIGVAAYPVHGNNLKALVEIADQRMYKVKKRSHDSTNEFTDNDKYEPLVIFPGNSKR